MIISDKSALEKLNSPKNLINSLKNSSKSNAMSLFIGKSKDDKIEVKKEFFNPFLNVKKEEVKEIISPVITQPGIDNLIENNETQVKLTLAHDQALKLLNQSTKLLFDKLDDIRADKLPTVITAAGKIVESIRKERSENSRNGNNKEIHHHYYMPQQKKLSDYEIVEGAVV
jgi:hypothetical protein